MARQHPTKAAPAMQRLRSLHSQCINTRSKDRLDHFVKCCRSLESPLDVKIIDLLTQSEIKSPESFIVYTIRTRQFPKIAELLLTNASLQEYVKDMKFSNGNNILHYVCARNTTECIRPLLEINCSVSTRNLFLSTPLHLAFEVGAEQSIREFVRFFRESPERFEEDIRKLFNLYNFGGRTVFHQAVQHGCSDLVEIFLEVAHKRGEKICEIRELHCGLTAAHLALLRGDFKMIQLLMQHDPEACNYENYAGNSVADIEANLTGKLSTL